MDRDAVYDAANTQVAKLLDDIEATKVEMGEAHSRFKVIADKLLEQLQALETTFEEEAEEINDELAEAKARRAKQRAQERWDRWKRSLAEQTKDQPASSSGDGPCTHGP
jgi:hypothetical protein